MTTSPAPRTATNPIIFGGDARSWDEDAYRLGILRERRLHSRTVFRTAFGPSPNPSCPETLVVASSDGSVSCYSLASCIDATTKMQLDNKIAQKCAPEILFVEPLRVIGGHQGPAYDVKFFGNGEDSLLVSCGDDGRIRGWNWREVVNLNIPDSAQGKSLKPILDLVNPQPEGPWNVRGPIPENNAIAADEQQGSIFSAAGDSNAYCWDVETGKLKTVFRGHSDYLHCITACKSSNQILTGSEDGTIRIWDCRNGFCAQVIHPHKNHSVKKSSWVSCIAIDESESWMVCGTGSGLSTWSLLSHECTFSITNHAPVQDLVFANNQILSAGTEPALTRISLSGEIVSEVKCAPQSVFSVSHHPSGVIAVGGYGGLVDVISQFGSHLCTFCCHGSD